MGSLTSLFNLSRSSLLADQAALDATAKNVANQNTAGYVRQLVSWEAGDTVTLSGAGTSALAFSGAGPAVALASKRDRVLEQRVQLQMQTQAETSARADVLSQIEGVFSLSGSSKTAGSTQLGGAIDTFFSSLSAFAASPSDGPTRQAVVGAAVALGSSFNAAAKQLSGIAQGINSELGSSVSEVNALTATVASLNQQIRANSAASDAGPLEDKRQQAIAQLSQLIGLDQVTTDGNGITLTTQGGAELVSGEQAIILMASVHGGSTEISDGSGVDITGTIQGGSIGGKLTAQKSDLPTVVSSLDALATRIATAVNAQNGAGLDGSGLPGGAVFGFPSLAAAPTGASPGGAAAALALVAAGGGAFASAAVGEGVSGNSNANALADLAQTIDASGNTISGSFAVLLAQVGTNSSGLTQQSAAQKTTLDQLVASRNQLSGVSLDEEAANLSQYQRSYEASAKLFSVLNSLMAAAINLGERTTVS